MTQRVVRLLLSLAGVGAITWLNHNLVTVNATTIGFAYLLLVLIVAAYWGFIEATITSIAATLAFNFFFLPPVRRFTIADPQNWVALFSFLATALIASRLSAEAKRQAFDAIARQRDVERLYTFSRAILLIDNKESFPTQLMRKLADIFGLSAAVLYERRSEELYRAGPSDFEGLEDQLRDAALRGSFFADAGHNRLVTAVRLGSEPIAGLAIQGPAMQDAVLQGVANLVAIGLERARAQELASQIEASRQGEKLRMTLLDAMAHEFKTPLTSVMAVTTSLLANPDQPAESKQELIRIADEEAKRLTNLIDETVEMGRLDSSNIRVQSELSNLIEMVREVVASMRHEIDSRQVNAVCGEQAVTAAVDRRLLKLAIKQLVDNALKYSTPDTPITIRVSIGDRITVAVTNLGNVIPIPEQARVFDRLYRSPSVATQSLGSGLGLSIAQDIVRAHRGELTVKSAAGETTFQISLPLDAEGGSV